MTPWRPFLARFADPASSLFQERQTAGNCLTVQGFRLDERLPEGGGQARGLIAVGMCSDALSQGQQMDW
jgi:hypothetical protein